MSVPQLCRDKISGDALRAACKNQQLPGFHTPNEVWISISCLGTRGCNVGPLHPNVTVRYMNRAARSLHGMHLLEEGSGVILPRRYTGRGGSSTWIAGPLLLCFSWTMMALLPAWYVLDNTQAGEPLCCVIICFCHVTAREGGVIFHRFRHPAVFYPPYTFTTTPTKSIAPSPSPPSRHRHRHRRSLHTHTHAGYPLIGGTAGN